MITQDWRHATPEQKNLWRLCSGILPIPPGGVQTITPLYYQGPLAGSEFLVYAATKLYICLDMYVSSITPHVIMDIATYDIADAINGYIQDYTGALVGVLNLQQTNFYFSRLLNATGTPYIKFNGYRLDVV